MRLNRVEAAAEVVDRGDRWQVVLDPLPTGRLGGTTDVFIDKRSRQVLNVVRTK